MPSSSAPLPWPVELPTDRLVLRPVAAGDVPAVSRLWTDPEVRRHLGGPVAPETVERRERGCVGFPGLLAVVSRDGDTVLGTVSLDPDARDDGRTEVSYSFLPEHWGRGYAREAVARVVSWALDQPGPEPRTVIAVTQEANARSRRLLASVGMSHTGSFVEYDAPQVLYAAVRDGAHAAS
jgi:RimJ/RimL family protein N-acetyltransferase